VVFRVGGAAGTDRQEHVGLRHGVREHSGRCDRLVCRPRRKRCVSRASAEFSACGESRGDNPRFSRSPTPFRPALQGGQRMPTAVGGRSRAITVTRAARSSYTCGCIDTENALQAEARASSALNLLYGASVSITARSARRGLIDNLNSGGEIDSDRVLGHRLPPTCNQP